ncbi:MAG: hypothetical protein LBC74_07080, partial [Planctomycetaceae bacterium]|nr:hypothetical protein [Planctomycetaceae bacterium]
RDETRKFDSERKFVRERNFDRKSNIHDSQDNANLRNEKKYRKNKNEKDSKGTNKNRETRKEEPREGKRFDSRRISGRSSNLAKSDRKFSHGSKHGEHYSKDRDPKKTRKSKQHEE